MRESPGSASSRSHPRRSALLELRYAESPLDATFRETVKLTLDVIGSWFQGRG